MRRRNRGRHRSAASASSGEPGQASTRAPLSSSSGRARQSRGSRVATASGHSCRPERAMSAGRMLPGTYSQRAFRARCTPLSWMQGVASSAVSWPWMCLTTSQVTLVSVATPVAVTSSPTGVQAASSGPSTKARTKGRRKEAARTVELERVRGATIGRSTRTSLERRRKKILSTPRARVREDCRRTVALGVTPCAVRFRACNRPRAAASVAGG